MKRVQNFLQRSIISYKNVVLVIVSILKFYYQKIPNHLKIGYHDNNDDLVMGDYQYSKVA